MSAKRFSHVFQDALEKARYYLRFCHSQNIAIIIYHDILFNLIDIFIESYRIE
jgi:hypothetical protein